jgi:dipeptidase E
MELHLLSSPGEGQEIGWVLEACRPYLEDREDPVVGYLPLATLAGERWLERTRREFQGLAGVETINSEAMQLGEMESILRRAALVYIPGGNTFLLSHRLHISRLLPHLKKKVQAGLPLVAFSAGTILCGPNILTSGDMNAPETPHFEGLGLTPFNFYVHYSGDGYLGAIQDDWLSEYHVFHDNPVIVMSDGAYVTVSGNKTRLVRGDAWLLKKGEDKHRISAGETIQAAA